MTKKEVAEHLRTLYFSQPNADWDMLAVGNVIVNKGQAWRITRIPPKRGFVMAEYALTGEVEKLLRSKYATPDLRVTDEPTLALLRTSHREEIEKAMAAGIGIRLDVQYDYPDLFTPFPASWDEEWQQKAHDIWWRINEMRAFYDRQHGPGWQFGRVDDLIAQAKEDIVRWKAYRAERDARAKTTKPEAIPQIVADVNDTICDLKEQVKILRHLRKHLEKTVTPKDVHRNRRKGRKAGTGTTGKNKG
jgi:hypothetical protein